MKNSNDFLLKIIKNIPNSIFVIDDKDNIIYYNNNFKKLTNIKNLINLKSSKIFKTPIINYIKYDSITIENKIINDKINKDIIININKIDNNIIGVCTDITNIKNFSERIRYAFLESMRIKDKSEKSEKLKSLFLSNISHELRTPLNAINGFSNLLIKSNKSKDDKKQYINIIKKNSDQLIKLIDDIIDISKIESNEIEIRNERCSLIEIIENVYDSNKIKINEKKIKFEIDKKTNIILYSDKYRIMQILNNLISNAIKFTESGYIKIGYYLEKHNIIFHVKDTGIGISKSDQEYIFESFKQVNEEHSKKYSGTGLGLSITEKLVKILGGEIWLESVINKGTEFYFTLPSDYVQKYMNEYNIMNKYGKRMYNWTNKNILISSDDLYINEMLCNIIEKNKTKCDIVNNGSEIIKKISEKSYDLLIIDIKLSDMHSYDIIKKVQDIPTIVKLPRSMLNIDKLIDLGFTDYIINPINASEVIKKIDRILN